MPFELIRDLDEDELSENCDGANDTTIELCAEVDSMGNRSRSISKQHIPIYPDEAQKWRFCWGLPFGWIISIGLAFGDYYLIAAEYPTGRYMVLAVVLGSFSFCCLIAPIWIWIDDCYKHEDRKYDYYKRQWNNNIDDLVRFDYFISNWGKKYCKNKLLSEDVESLIYEYWEK